jgi:cytochrome c oxidase subunit IV
MMQPIVPRHVYHWVYAALIALTLLTVGIAKIDLGPLNLAVGLAIAICKALLVMYFFMQLRYSTHLTWIVAATGFIWVGHLILFTMSDYLTRGWTPRVGW